MSGSPQYDPAGAGPFAVGVRTIEARDTERGRTFPVELWYPAEAASLAPLVVFSHRSGGDRRSASYLTAHLASHGYVVAAMDHSERVDQGLVPSADSTPEERSRLIQAIIGGRVPDVRFLLSYLLAEPSPVSDLRLDADHIGVAGHSFGGWTALAVPEQDGRAGAVLALAPGGASRPRPGVLPLELAFGWSRPAPLLILTGDADVPIPLEGVQEVFERAPAPKRMFVLRRADHQHFGDEVEATHETLRAMTLPGEAAWMTAAMRPASELCSGADAHLFTRALATAHFDATLRGSHEAQRFLDHEATAMLAACGVDAWQVTDAA
jgi:dienelactone hydrolase